MSNKILVVDDEQAIRDNIKKLLEIYGYEVSTASDGIEALNIVANEKFDVYLLDVLMPGMDGLELMQKIKLVDPISVIIIITGYSSIEGGIKAVRSGAFHYLTKPITKEELFKVIDKGIKRHEELLKNIYNPTQGLSEETDNFLDSQMLRGFSSDDKAEFHEIAEIHSYEPGFNIPMLDDPGSIILIESGDISVWIGETQVDRLHKGESWGEETFVSPSYLFTSLKAESETSVEHYSRKKIIEYFTYKDESLTKRFTINLMTILYLKWKKAIVKIGNFTGYENYRI
jgi:CheY-like chemotaxis protein